MSGQKRQAGSVTGPVRSLPRDEEAGPVSTAGADPGRKSLYRVAGVAILLAVTLFRQNCGAELDVSGGFGIVAVPDTIPQNALGWFGLFRDNTLAGLVWRSAGC